ncbi:hypothetical protein ACFL4N_05485 [Thermodesulfobacteriota bacterium]
MPKIIFSFIFLVLFNVCAVQGAEKDLVVLETEGTYVKGAGDSKSLAKALALFDAKRQAVQSAGRYLSKKGLIKAYEMNKDEIYNLVADGIEVNELDEKWVYLENGVRCAVRIRARVKDSDFVRAEILNRKLELEDQQETFREEMEPTIPKAIEPGMEIAKAYQLLRRKKWRRAIIYLDRLEIKYPHWGEVSMAKAIGYYVLHEPVSMRKALVKACKQGKQRACKDLETIKRVHNVDIAP